MKTLLYSLTIVGLALSAPSASFAQDKKEAAAAATKPTGAGAPAAEKPAASMKTLPFQGKVGTVDAAAKTFTIKNKDGKENTYAITDKTQILHGDATAASMSDIKADETVRGSRMKTGENQWEAMKVIIGAKPGSGEPKAKKGEAKADAKAADEKK